MLSYHIPYHYTPSLIWKALDVVVRRQGQGVNTDVEMKLQDGEVV